MDKYKKYLSKFIKWKNNGSTVAADMIPAVITIVITGILLLFYSSWVYNFETREYINSIAREYILRMETKGCLTESDRDLLLTELQSKGVEDISFDGTTTSPVDNGNLVTLKIAGKVNYRQFSIDDLFKWNFDDFNEKKNIEITQCTTAIY